MCSLILSPQELKAEVEAIKKNKAQVLLIYHSSCVQLCDSCVFATGDLCPHQQLYLHCILSFFTGAQAQEGREGEGGTGTVDVPCHPIQQQPHLYPLVIYL
jgi:hypothetical protein